MGGRPLTGAQASPVFSDVNPPIMIAVKRASSPREASQTRRSTRRPLAPARSALASTMTAAALVPIED